MEDLLKQAIEKELKRMLEGKFEEFKDQMIKELDREKDKVLAGMVLHVMEVIQIQRMGSEIVIRLESKNLKNEN